MHTYAKRSQRTVTTSPTVRLTPRISRGQACKKQPDHVALQRLLLTRAICAKPGLRVSAPSDAADKEADALATHARAPNAKAFSLRNDVAFAEGPLPVGQPQAVRRLSAHEPAHVIQQGQAAPLAGDVANTEHAGVPRVDRQEAEATKPKAEPADEEAYGVVEEQTQRSQRVAQKFEPAPTGLRLHRELELAVPAPQRAQWTRGSLPLAVSMLGQGRPLNASERALFPNRAGELGDVQVHDDQRAKAMTALLGNVGYAAGNHVVLGPGVGESEADRTLAHELVHVLQQRHQAGRPLAQDAEREADQFADRAMQREPNGYAPDIKAAPMGFMERVIARYTHDLPNDLLLVIDIDDGDFVGGCVRAIVPHVGAKLIMKKVPKGVGNQLFNIHMGVTTNAQGEACFFFYESVSGFCDMTCSPTLDELKKRLKEIRDWLEEKIERVLRLLLPVAIAAVVAYLIADAIITALAAAGILVLA